LAIYAGSKDAEAAAHLSAPTTRLGARGRLCAAVVTCWGQAPSGNITRASRAHVCPDTRRAGPTAGATCTPPTIRSHSTGCLRGGGGAVGRLCTPPGRAGGAVDDAFVRAGAGVCRTSSAVSLRRGARPDAFRAGESATTQTLGLAEGIVGVLANAAGGAQPGLSRGKGAWRPLRQTLWIGTDCAGTVAHCRRMAGRQRLLCSAGVPQRQRLHADAAEASGIDALIARGETAPLATKHRRHH